MQPIFLFIFPILFPCIIAAKSEFTNRTFLINYEDNRFLKNDQPYQCISGAIHYFRVHEYYWEDRIEKLRAAGLNAIETYVPWNFHEPWPGRFDFSGRANLTEFIRIAEKLNLDVILRMGPYVCAELDNGGLPWWLMKLYPDIRMRTNDARYLYHVSKWYFKLMPMITPLLYKNGGPVIMLQVENEYGSFNACDHEYMSYLRDLFKSYAGEDTVMFTVDGGTMRHLKCGYTPELYPTIDFGTNDSILEGFSAQRFYAPHGPLINMEFYPGWLDLWGFNHSKVETRDILEYMSAMYNLGASFNFYVFHGGTSFGYTSGAVGRRPATTSYDYDAPLSEAGDPTPKYVQIRKHIEKMTGVKNPYPMPKSTPKRGYGTIQTTLLGSIFDLMRIWENVTAKYPMTFEALNFPYGFILYETVIQDDPDPGNLTVLGIRDRGYVMVNETIQSIVSNMDKKYDLLIDAKNGSKLRILVENNGRPTKGTTNPKGLIINATLDGKNLTDWIMYPILMEHLLSRVECETPRMIKPFLGTQDSGFGLINNTNKSYVPSFYFAKFSLTKPIEDTFMNMGNWSKGHIFINQFNLGRYWASLGPQVTLYVPKPVLKEQGNSMLIFELEKPGNCDDDSLVTCEFSFIDYPILDKIVPGTVDREPF